MTSKHRSVQLSIALFGALLVSACGAGATSGAPARANLGPAAAQPAGASGMSARIRALEAQPFGELANTERTALMLWVSETPTIGVNMVPLLGTFEDLHALYGEDAGDAVYFHYVLGMARFILEHPDRPQNSPVTSSSIEVQAAGVRSALGFYQRMRVSAPQLARHALCEQLLTLSSRGALERHVGEELHAYGIGG